MGILASAAVAAAVSLDGLAAGMSLAAAGIHLRPGARLLIALMAMGVSGLTMAGARFLGAPLPTRWAARLGGLLLLGLGVALLARGGREARGWRGEGGSAGGRAARSLGLMVRILRHPSDADLDRSGEIRGIEVLWLGTALALDSGGAGVGAALARLSLFWTPVLVGALNFVALLAGGRAGTRLLASRSAGAGLGQWAPGLVLIVVGLLTVLRA